MGTSDSKLEIDTSDPVQLTQRADGYVRQAERNLDHRPFYKNIKHVQEGAADDFVQAATSYKLAKKRVYDWSFLWLKLVKTAMLHKLI